jgi:ATP-dependent RNA helicase DHX29
MAPKKKKKAASNPARGFATVSVPSKTKADDGVIEPEAVSADVGHAESTSHESRGAVDISQPLQESSFQKMTADQMEAHLEDAELQIIVDKFADRSKREAVRQVAKLETERRTLRAQAMPLETDDWLSEGLVQEICTLYRSCEGEQESSLCSLQADKELQQDDLLVKLWTLQQVLKLLHIPHEERVLKHVVSLTSDLILKSKDYVWGLEESLDWLALQSSPEELPLYQPSVPSSRPFHSEYSIPASSSESSRAASPTRMVNGRSRAPVIQSTIPSTAVSGKADRQDHSDKKLASSSDTDESTDDDNDPDGLVSRYIDTKLQLLRLEPEFHHDKSATTKSEYEKELKPSQVSRLRRRVENIERDILFDHEKANAQLNDTLNQFRPDISKRRAERCVTKPLTKDSSGASTPQATSEGPEALLDPADSEDAVDDLFGDMFASAETFPPTHKHTAQNEYDDSILLVDFGKWAGISPRRVLEDTCKTR